MSGVVLSEKSEGWKTLSSFLKKAFKSLEVEGGKKIDAKMKGKVAARNFIKISKIDFSPKNFEFLKDKKLKAPWVPECPKCPSFGIS